jgi:hypothetical protein
MNPIAAQAPKSLARPIEETLPELEAALEALLRAAMAVGRGDDASAVQKAKKARAVFSSALEALRRTERREGRDGACSTIRSAMSVSERSKSSPHSIVDYKKSVLLEIQNLKQATW